MLSKYTLDQLGTKGHGIASAFSNVSGKVNKIHSNIQTQRANEKAKGGDRDNWGAWEKDIRNSLYKHFIICFWFLLFLVFFFFFFYPFRAVLTTYGSSQARGPIGAAAAGPRHSHICSLHHRHGNADRSSTEDRGQGFNARPRGCQSGSLTAEPRKELPKQLSKCIDKLLRKENLHTVSPPHHEREREGKEGEGRKEGRKK